jgi:hypothetical protein
MAKEQISEVALFIDADNLPPSAVDWVFEHWRRLEVLVPVRRAYGGHEKLAGMKDVLTKHAVRTFVNQGKGTTDVALVVDVMDLLHRDALPAAVGIVSSDADFAPLALRLREAGTHVLCFAKRDNADADALLRAYDEVAYVDVPQAMENLTPAVTTVQQASQTLKASSPIGDTPVALTTHPEDHKAVRSILAALPEWLPNTVMQLNQLGTPLRESGIAKGSTPLHELFRKHPAYFKVLPTTGPAKQIRLLKKPT